MDVGKRIKERRQELGLSADHLADVLGKNRSTIYRYESGYIENMPIEILEPIAKALQTTPAYLMGWDVDEIETISNIQNDANIYEDIYESEIKQISELGLTAEELNDVLSYASYIRSKRE